MAFGNPANINVTVNGGSGTLPNVWAKPVVINRNTSNTAQVGDIGTDQSGTPTLLDDYVSLNRVSSTDGFTYSNTAMGTQTSWTQVTSNGVNPATTASYTGITVSDGSGDNTKLNYLGLSVGATPSNTWMGGAESNDNSFMTFFGPNDGSNTPYAIGIGRQNRPLWGSMNTNADTTKYPHGSFNALAALVTGTDFVPSTVGQNQYLVLPGQGGLVLSWIRTTVSLAFSASYGSLYTTTWDWTFPYTYKSTPMVTCGQFLWGTGASWGLVSGASASKATLRGMDVQSRAAGNTVITAFAIGV